MWFANMGQSTVMSEAAPNIRSMFHQSLVMRECRVLDRSTVPGRPGPVCFVRGITAYDVHTEHGYEGMTGTGTAGSVHVNPELPMLAW
jgi:hypothetical protein